MTMRPNPKVTFISDTGVVQEVEGIEIGVLDGAPNWVRLADYEPQIGERVAKPEPKPAPKPFAKKKRTP